MLVDINDFCKGKKQNIHNCVYLTELIYAQ